MLIKFYSAMHHYKMKKLIVLVSAALACVCCVDTTYAFHATFSSSSSSSSSSRSLRKSHIKHNTNNNNKKNPAFYPTVIVTTSLKSSAPSDVDFHSIEEYHSPPECNELKLKLLQLCASYDRGFGASPSAREQVDDIIEQLKVMNPTPVDAARGIEGGYSATYDDNDDEGSIPLKGIWRMVWTTALDVLNLAASPIASPAAIYQVIEPPIATNIIDFIPRAQSLLPTSFPSSLLRAEVLTRTSKRPESNRVGLDFEAVKLAPVEFLGMDVSSLPPFGINFPKINLQDLPGVDPANAPGFFDVVYLDDDMLIIKQNEPGGYFVSIKVPSCDP